MSTTARVGSATVETSRVIDAVPTGETFCSASRTKTSTERLPAAPSEATTGRDRFQQGSLADGAVETAAAVARTTAHQAVAWPSPVIVSFALLWLVTVAEFVFGSFKTTDGAGGAVSFIVIEAELAFVLTVFAEFATQTYIVFNPSPALKASVDGMLLYQPDAGPLPPTHVEVPLAG